MSPKSVMTSADIAIYLLLFTGRVGGVALHWGVLPPPAGQARSAALQAAGQRELKMARALYSRALDEVGCSEKHYLQGPRAPWWIYGPPASRFPSCSLRRRRREGEGPAREALGRAVNALNLLEDLREADEAHALIHEVGAFVSWHFGCKIGLSDGEWQWRCPVILSHLRFGNSVGFTAIRYCSICDEDISECDHLPDRLYRVTVTDPSNCPCGNHSCTHLAGDSLEVYPHAVTKEADLEEVSVVARPRDPLARYSELLFTPRRMARMMGRDIPAAVRGMECFHCRQECTGMWGDQALGRLLGKNS